MSDENTNLHRRYADNHVFQNVATYIIVGFLSAMFTSYVATEKLKLELQYLREDIELIKSMATKTHELGERVAVLESRDKK